MIPGVIAGGGIAGAPAAPLSVGRTSGNTTTSTAQPRLHMSKFTVSANGTLDTGHLISGVTSVNPKVKCVIYSDNAGVPDTLLATTAEQSGLTNGVTYDLPYLTPLAVTAGQVIWIGIFTGGATSTVHAQSGTSGTPWVNSNTSTYASGPPASYPGSATTGSGFQYAFWATGTAS
jgi:hypothetical protein